MDTGKDPVPQGSQGERGISDLSGHATVCVCFGFSTV